MANDPRKRKRQGSDCPDQEWGASRPVDPPERPRPHCDPPKEPSFPEFTNPAVDLPPEPLQQSPDAILVGNTEVSVTCEEEWNQVNNDSLSAPSPRPGTPDRITVPENEITEYFRFQNARQFLDTNDLDRISKIQEIDPSKIKNALSSRDPEHVATEFGLGKNASENLISIFNQFLVNIQERATNLALSRLDCGWESEEVRRECGDQSLKYNEILEKRNDNSLEKSFYRYAGVVNNKAYYSTDGKIEPQEDTWNCVFFREDGYWVEHFYQDKIFVGENVSLLKISDLEEVSRWDRFRVSFTRDKTSLGNPVVLPQGWAFSSFSQEQADNAAVSEAARKLRCVWTNQKTIRKCSDIGYPDLDPDDVNPKTEEEFGVHNGSENGNEIKEPDSNNFFINQVTVSSGIFTSSQSKEVADQNAEIAALAGLNCFYLNTEQTIRCDKDDYIEEGVVYGEGRRGNPVTIPADITLSRNNWEEANNTARALGQEWLDCYYENETLVYACDDYKSDPNNPEEVRFHRKKDFYSEDLEFLPVMEAIIKSSPEVSTGPLHFVPGSEASRIYTTTGDLLISEEGVFWIFFLTVNRQWTFRKFVDGQEVEFIIPEEEENGIILSDPAFLDNPDLATGWNPVDVEINLPQDVQYPGPMNRSQKVGQTVYSSSFGRSISLMAVPSKSERYFVEIPKGTTQSNVSQEEANRLAALLALSRLRCTYCNPRIDPVCAPEGIDPKTAELPLDVSQMISDGIIEDERSLSMDFSRGVPGINYVVNPMDSTQTELIVEPGFFTPDYSPGKTHVCGQYPAEVTSLADSAGLVPYRSETPQDRDEGCRYGNPTIVYTCNASKLEEVEKSQYPKDSVFISRGRADAEHEFYTDRIIVVPENSFVVQADKESDSDEDPSTSHRQEAREQAFNLARSVAVSQSDCYYQTEEWAECAAAPENRIYTLWGTEVQTETVAEGIVDPAESDEDATWFMVTKDGIRKSGRNAEDFSRNSEDTRRYGVGISYNSFQEAKDNAKLEARSKLICFYGNDIRRITEVECNYGVPKYNKYAKNIGSWDIISASSTRDANVTAETILLAAVECHPSDYVDRVDDRNNSSSGPPTGGGGGGGGGFGNDNKNSSSSKSNAIVQASFRDSGYAALFITEMPEVRFEDVHHVEFIPPFTTATIDPWYLEVCEPGTMVVSGWSSDEACPLGVTVENDKLLITAPPRWEEIGNYPKNIIVRLSGIRKGHAIPFSDSPFDEVRFPAKSEKQFLQNEEFINSAYDAEP